ncbi:hypothetical protein [Scytonema sp. UIC 10036]|uniref:hypothetical protein n=1 Tax=Scytonema sp. UIC 10036 TaxID=2304196 RepID=UPI00325B7B0C
MSQIFNDFVDFLPVNCPPINESLPVSDFIAESIFHRGLNFLYSVFTIQDQLEVSRIFSVE